MKCTHCNEELGDGDSYDLMTSHMYSCNSQIARKTIDSIDKSSCHGDYCTCEECI